MDLKQFHLAHNHAVHIKKIDYQFYNDQKNHDMDLKYSQYLP